MKLTINFLVLIFGVLLANAVYAQSPREQLKEMVEQLQQSPDDDALREKIIKFALKLKPAPALPDDAVTFAGSAQLAFRAAKSDGDLVAAARKYEKAVTAAPWVPGYYDDLCSIYEKAKKFEDAKLQCVFYLIGVTNPVQKIDVKRRIASLESSIEKADADKRHAAEAANSPHGRAAAMIDVLSKQFAGPVKRILICGVLLNQHWNCTDEEAQGNNWVDSVDVDSLPKSGMGSVKYKIADADSDLVEITLGSYSWPQGSFNAGEFIAGCAKPDGADPNSLLWVSCPGQENAGNTLEIAIQFMISADGSPLIEYRDGLGVGSYRRAQYFLQPNP